MYRYTANFCESFFSQWLPDGQLKITDLFYILLYILKSKIESSTDSNNQGPLLGENIQWASNSIFMFDLRLPNGSK